MTSPDLNTNLPPGQRAIEAFPRFGLTPYAERYQKDFGPLKLHVAGDCLQQALDLEAEDLQPLKRIEFNADFHCVTSWTKQNLCWSGYSFESFYTRYVISILKNNIKPHWVIFKSIDGYRSRLLIEDLLKSNVMLADTLNGQPLCAIHGAPLRLVAPKHYGYKNPKYLKSIAFYGKDYRFKPPLLSFMEHPRARVELEERGQYIPGWILRYAYRPMIQSTIDLFKRTM